MTNQDRARQFPHRPARAVRSAPRTSHTRAAAIPGDVLRAVTGGQAVPEPRERPDQPRTEDKSWTRRAGEFARDASGGFVSGLLGFRSDEQLWGESNRVSREFGGFGEFLGTRQGGRRIPRR